MLDQLENYVIWHKYEYIEFTGLDLTTFKNNPTTLINSMAQNFHEIYNKVITSIIFKIKQAHTYTFMYREAQHTSLS